MHLHLSLNSALGLKSGLVGAVAAEPSPENVYEEEEVAGKEPGGVSTPVKTGCDQMVSYMSRCDLVFCRVIRCARFGRCDNKTLHSCNFA